MAVALASNVDARPRVELRVERWRGRRDAVFAAALAGLVIALLAAPLPGGERVIPLAAIVAVVLGWSRSLLEHWTIAGDELSHRGWLGSRTVTVTRSTDVSVGTDEHGPAEVVIAGGTRISVPLDEVRRNPEFAAELRRLLARSATGAPANL